MVTRPEYNIHNGRIAGRRPLADWYDYLLDDDPDKQFELRITHLVHFTENDFARAIGLGDADSFRFKPNNWKPDNNEFKYLSWWSPDPPENWGDDIRNHENFDNYMDGENRFCTSPIFNGDSVYGPIGFVVSWKDILVQYAASREKDRSDIQLKRFGTFLYTREIMYVILVCIEGDEITYKDQDNNDREFDLIEDETEAFRQTGTDEDFIWKFYNTTYGWNSNKRFWENPSEDTWDHLSFIFYFPEENDRLIIPPNLCKIKKKEATKFRTGGRPNRISSEMRANDIVKELTNKINLTLWLSIFKDYV